MMTPAAKRPAAAARKPDTLLVLEHRVLARAALAEYLRSCGYRVVEARSSDEALQILRDSAETIHTVLSDAENGFRVSAWIKANRPGTRLILAATFEHAAHAAAKLCDVGPHARRPYEPQLLAQRIKARLANDGE